MLHESSVGEAGQIQLPPPPFALTPVAWSDGQLARLHADCRAVLRSFAFHPFVTISATRGDPPTYYRVDFRVRALVLDASEQLQYVERVPMEIWIPSGYPSQPPLVRPLIAVFHPNFSFEEVQFAADWHAAQGLIQVIHRVGDWLAWRSYDPDAVINEIAMQWMLENAGVFPLDARADFSPNVGGEPMGRIARFGPAELDRVRQSIDEKLAALGGETAGPSLEQVRKFSQQTRAAIQVFLEPDVSAEMRQRAHELEQFVLDLPASVPSWEHLRRLKDSSKSILAASAELKRSAGKLSAALNTFASLVTLDVDSAAGAIDHLPPSAVLSPWLMQLPAQFKDTATRFEAQRSRLSSLQSKRPPNVLGPESIVGRHLAIKLKHAEEDIEFAVHTGREVVAALDPPILSARAEVLALKAIGRWREYLDVFATAAVLENELAQLSGDAIEAYFVELPDGTFGPYQFEQEIVLGAARVYLSPDKLGAIEIRDAGDDRTLRRGIDGAASAMVPLQDGSSVLMSFTFSRGTEQPLLQLDYAIEQTRSLLPRLHAAGKSDAQSWCGKMLNLLARADARRATRGQLADAVHGWEELADELRQVASFKARVSTYFLVTRSAAVVSNLISQREAHRERIAEAKKRILPIAEKSGRDPDDRLVVPAKFARTYMEEIAAMEAARNGLTRIESRLKSISAKLADRLASAPRCGRPEVPALQKLQPISRELAELAAGASDERMLAAVASLAETLNASLVLNLPPAPPAHAKAPHLDDGQTPIESEMASEAPALPDPGATQPWAEESDDVREQLGEAGIEEQGFPSLDPAANDESAASAEASFATDEDQSAVEEEGDWIEQ